MSFSVTHLSGFGYVAVTSITPDNVNRIPTMTAATTSGVTISCSNENGISSYASWRGANATVGDSFLNSTSNTAYTWKVDFGAGNTWVIQSYRMTEIHSGEYVGGARHPASWTFEGSNDDSNWTTIDSRSSQTSVAANNAITWNVTNQTAYRYYRFSVAAKASQLTGWAEMELRT